MSPRSTPERLRPFSLIAATILLPLSIVGRPVSGQTFTPTKLVSRLEAATVEFAATADELDSLIDRQVDLRGASGEWERGLVVTDLVRDPSSNRFKAVRAIRPGDSHKWSVSAADLAEVDSGEFSYRAVAMPASGGVVLENATRRRSSIELRLRKLGRRFWKSPTPEQQLKFVAQDKASLEAVSSYFARLPLRLYETCSFLFLTDIPPQQIGAYILQLDEMSARLGAAFGYPPGHNIWRGKAIVVAFVERDSFREFEYKFFDGTNANFAQGLCHNGENGRVMVSCWRGNDPDYFASTLVHETAHGYVHRHLTNVEIPVWLNEGVAEWAGSTAATSACRRRQADAAEALSACGTFGGAFFEAKGRLETWQYGAASAIVDLQLRLGPSNFRLFFDGIKEGLPWEESLDRAYGRNVDELCLLFGRTIGVPDLTP